MSKSPLKADIEACIVQFLFDSIGMQTGDDKFSGFGWVFNSWTLLIKQIMKSSFKDVGKGWFNLKETNLDAYNFSKMKRYLTMVRYMMEDSLRFLTEHMLIKYTNFIERHIGAARVELKSINDVSTEWPINDFATVRLSYPQKPQNMSRLFLCRIPSHAVYSQGTRKPWTILICETIELSSNLTRLLVWDWVV